MLEVSNELRTKADKKETKLYWAAKQRIPTLMAKGYKKVEENGKDVVAGYGDELTLMSKENKQTADDKDAHNKDTHATHATHAKKH